MSALIITTADAVAATLVEAMHRHVPGFRGMFHEQLLAIANEVLAEHGDVLTAETARQGIIDKYGARMSSVIFAEPAISRHNR